MRKVTVLQSALIGMLASGAFAATTTDTTATEEEQVREILSEGVQLYRTGRYDDAAYTLANGIAALEANANGDPAKLREANRLLYEFTIAMGDRIVINMRERAELEEVMESVLRRARIYERELRTDPKYINLLIDKVIGRNEEERLVATTELVAIGPLAVPHLVTRLVDSRQDEDRVWCRVVLTRMHYRAVLPLIEALNAADDRLVSSVATILADIGDPRALPKLQALRESADTSETLRRVADNSVAAIAARSAYSEVPSAALLYFQEAVRYFRGGEEVRRELFANQSLTWRWKEEEEGFRQLHYDFSPRYAWNEIVAQELAFDGIAADPEFLALHPLLAAINEAMVVEAGQRLAIAQDRTAGPALGSNPEATGETVELLQARVDALEEMEDRVIMAGPEYIYRGIRQAIGSQRYDVAFHMMDLLRDPDLARPESLLPTKEEGLHDSKAGTVLVAALDHSERRVRYHAAATLAHLDPKLQFFNSERVIPLLAEAVGEWDMTAVLAIEPDFRHRNAVRGALQDGGLLAYTAGDGFEGRLRLNEAPAKDAIIIAGDLTPTLRDEHGVIIDVAEQTPLGLVQLFKSQERTADTPIFISLPADEELSLQIQNAFGELQQQGLIAGFVHRPYQSLELKGTIELATGDAATPSVNRDASEAISKLAAEALASIDPVFTQFDLSQAVDALLATIRNRQDYVRIPALHALGHIAPEGILEQVTSVYLEQLDGSAGDASTPEMPALTGRPETRAAFLYCIGRLDATNEISVDILKQALMAGRDASGVREADYDDHRVVRRAAAEAIGHHPGGSLSGALLDEFQRQQRLDVRSLRPSAE